MNSKTVGTLLAVSVFTGLLITGACMYLWSTHPELFGIEQTAPVAKKICLKDSAETVSPEEVLRSQNERLNTELASLRDSLRTANSAIAQTSARVQQLDESLSATHREHAKEELQRKDSTRLKNIQIAAEMYEKGQPAEIAKILSEADPDYVVSVLKIMKRKNAAQILERMPTDKAVRVSKMMARK